MLYIGKNFELDTMQLENHHLKFLTDIIDVETLTWNIGNRHLYTGVIE